MNSCQTFTDAELMLLCKNGNATAFEEIYNRYWGILFGHARKMLQDNDQAKDAVQDIFTTFWIKASELEIKTSVSAYLYTCLRNKILDSIAKNKVKTNYLSSITNYQNNIQFIADDFLVAKQLAQHIEAEVANLPPKMKAVFELSRNHYFTYKAIAQQLNITDNTVKKQISNALKILRFKLGPLLSAVIMCAVNG
jgi:RNA polymerase sigma-70 factor, ECF subfamily